jgi:hypothetical protein
VTDPAYSPDGALSCHDPLGRTTRLAHVCALLAQAQVAAVAAPNPFYFQT